ncbi:YhgE/Pip domain-containing protein [Kocuria sp.]|uniref:YhgE/Pip domain-containing protein n=1 Tax=Kocuria sp. TaxID=1871328 RepID=UPI0026E088B7|nr:ABC transporter permease [Kocuria sp.]MDO5618483.1 DUF3533 domain-containing protein [Kocuria sp.]
MAQELSTPGNAHQRATLWELPKTVRWLLPPVAVMVIGFLGILLYLGGLGSPADHMEDMPVAVVNQDTGTTVTQADGSQTQENLGTDLSDSLVEKVNDSGEFKLTEMSMSDAEEALASGEVYGAIVIPAEFSEQSMALVPAAVGGDGDGTQPVIELLTSPQAGSMSSRLVTEGLTPALESGSTSIGDQLSQAADQQVAARQAAGQQVPEVTTVAQDVLKDPVKISTQAWQDLDDGTALGMGPFYWSIVLLVVGLSGAVAVSTLVDGILGIIPVEMGSSFRKYRTVALSRFTSFFLKWGIMVAAGAATAGLMMLAASIAGMPMPHGGLLFLISWLAISTVSAVTLALLTIGGSLGLILAMIYLIFLGLPSAGAVVPIEALPGFFTWLARIEPLHYTWLGVRDVLFFGAERTAGLGTSALGLSVILVIALVLTSALAPVWDRLSGRRGLAHGFHNAHTSSERDS